MALGIGIESLKFSVWLLPTSSQGPVIVYSRDGQTPLRQPRTTAHVDMKRYQTFPYLPNAVVASEDSRFTGTLGLTAWHFTSRGGKCWRWWVPEGADRRSKLRVACLRLRGTQDSLCKLREATAA